MREAQDILKGTVQKMFEEKNLWETYPEIWPTKGKFFTWLRGQLRRALWEKYPPKLKFKNERCAPPPIGLETRAKTGTHCALTGNWVGKSRLEVDHIVGEASLRGWEDFVPFCMHLLTTTENMQLVDKEAHKVKSYAERMGITFEEAQLRKSVIAFSKLPTNEMKNVLQSHKNYETIRSVVESKTKPSKKFLTEIYEQMMKGVEVV